MPYRWNPLSARFDRVADESGEVNGPVPASSTDNAVARWDGTTGRLLQNSVVIIDDSGAVTGATSLEVDNLQLNGNTISSTDVDGDISITPNGAGNIVLSSVTIDDVGAITGATSLAVDNLQLDGNTLSSTDVDGNVVIEPNGAGNIVLPSLSGFLSSNGASGVSARTLSAGSSKITVSNGDGTGGNPTVDADESQFSLNNIGGTLSVSKGGTGATTLTDHGVLVGSGTSAVTPLSVGTNGQVLLGSTGADPVFGTLTSSDGSISFTTGAGSLSIQGTQSTTSQLGSVELATTAEVTTGTDTSRVPSVASMIGHEGIAKAWVKFAMNGTFSDGFNISSVTDTGTGQATVNFTTSFAGTNFVAVANPQDGGASLTCLIDTQAVGSCLIEFRSVGVTPALTDPATGGHALFIGDR